MYKKGANFIVNGKKLNLNENSFGITQRKKKKKKKRKKKRVKSVKTQPVSAAYRIPSDLVQKIILMAPPSRTARIIQDNIREQREARIRSEEDAQIAQRLTDRWNETMRWSSDSEDWYAPSHSGEPGLYRGEVMELPSSEREIVMDTLRNRPVGYWPEPSF